MADLNIKRIIDADVHPWVNGDIAGLKPYLEKGWYEHFEGRYRLPDHPLRPPLVHATSIRQDATPPGGGTGGSDPKYVLKDLLEPNNINYAILSSVQAGKIVALPNAQEARVLASAFNDYFLNEWVEMDSRYRLAMAVAVHDPSAAVQEIRRIGHHPGICAIYMPLVNILMGQSHYYPIYEAAQEFDLPILIHPTGTEGGFALSVHLTGGVPTSYIERHTNFPQIAMSQIVSMVFEGVFVRFPKLRILAAEYGYSWVPGLLWRMDQNWKNFRREVPWLKRQPSEYVFEHVRFTTQPIEEPPLRKFFDQIMEMMHGEDMLLFSTDYPHWDNDFPNTVPLLNYGELFRSKVFYENAMNFFRLGRDTTAMGGQ